MCVICYGDYCELRVVVINGVRILGVVVIKERVYYYVNSVDIEN